MTSDPSTAAGAQIRVLTYNVHGCKGNDRRIDPARIAAVIAACQADIIALQEVDVGRSRSGAVDQAEAIARTLNIRSHFHPALHLGEERYGDAIMTGLPLTVLKAGALPSIGEPRGAILGMVKTHGVELVVANTHLGLRRRERRRQVAELLGSEWLDHPNIRDLPTVFLGDFNAVPWSLSYRHLTRSFEETHTGPTLRGAATFPARLPLIRIDHVFMRNGLTSRRAEVIDTPLSRVASDHLPVLVELALPAI
ncbi:endonuclease/exonuclease/phosphatase family protein [Nitratireductor sp. ZSWI3]|uniref:endonuclease/exonuclease/phosphatase family protein n=1 Tax=Nitratireductor sp. ZSWI3 TaxID=2966359 RepID=UPI00214FBC3E|nr:endonuclease/exonuclease/phosphatase family protein [Nitratireductor sp. ZSWI3]MCR4264702.1 endonuclease/exonuclease/phosphatase family protein [Nitratireductor sp. ZSWI3]